MANQAVFRDRRMLISKRPAILRVAAQTELVLVGGLEIAAVGPAMGIVTIDTAHFAFAQRVMIRHAQLRIFRGMTLQAGFIGLPSRAYHVIGFRG